METALEGGGERGRETLLGNNPETGRDVVRTPPPPPPMATERERERERERESSLGNNVHVPPVCIK